MEMIHNSAHSSLGGQECLNLIAPRMSVCFVGLFSPAHLVVIVYSTKMCTLFYKYSMYTPLFQ